MSPLTVTLWTTAASPVNRIGLRRRQQLDAAPARRPDSQRSGDAAERRHCPQQIRGGGRVGHRREGVDQEHLAVGGLRAAGGAVRERRSRRCPPAPAGAPRLPETPIGWSRAICWPPTTDIDVPATGATIPGCRGSCRVEVPAGERQGGGRERRALHVGGDVARLLDEQVEHLVQREAGVAGQDLRRGPASAAWSWR